MRDNNNNSNNKIKCEKERKRSRLRLSSRFLFLAEVDLNKNDDEENDVENGAQYELEEVELKVVILYGAELDKRPVEPIGRRAAFDRVFDTFEHARHEFGR